MADPRSEWKPVPANGVISEPGRYCLTQDLLVERSPGISIQADSVTVDFAGHALRYSGTPQPGINGIVANGCTHLTIGGGSLGGFWYNVHASDCRNLRIHDMEFDDVPYIGINAPNAEDMVICENGFSNFGYDVSKAAEDHYVVAINTGAVDAVIAYNRFDARVRPGVGSMLNVETVFVLFSADVTKNCVVAHNQMHANETLNRGYAIWIATGAQAVVVNNSISNMQYGVCLGGAASAVVGYNDFSVDPPWGKREFQTYGISATGARSFIEFENRFSGLGIPVGGAQSPAPDHSGTGLLRPPVPP